MRLCVLICSGTGCLMLRESQLLKLELEELSVYTGHATTSDEVIDLIRLCRPQGCQVVIPALQEGTEVPRQPKRTLKPPPKFFHGLCRHANFHRHTEARGRALPRFFLSKLRLCSCHQELLLTIHRLRCWRSVPKFSHRCFSTHLCICCIVQRPIHTLLHRSFLLQLILHLLGTLSRELLLRLNRRENWGCNFGFFLVFETGF
mmetsp:Transcript_51477/g.130010  ORF Transcript_51477/g.130010 Transcript_51477/m.130010 type:complete len:203 (-) Transcript_51477:2281-2889(-)